MDFEKCFESLPTSLCSHPSQPLFAVGLVDGSVGVYNYKQDVAAGASEEAITEVWLKKHKAAVRKVRTSTNGSSLLTITKNRALCLWDTETGSKKRCIRRSHDRSPYALCVMDENNIATGDEEGVVRLWDWRSQRPCIASMHDNSDYITDIAADPSRKTLLATCGDGTLSAFSTSKRKLIIQSEVMQSELLSIAIVLNGKQKVFNFFFFVSPKIS
ncbi:unnamed protein product [Soboliphyme baturini]|uniref:WD_REPEATS_REGION domain-containing protein n=1 Tax=Soboliphyme baturini TaxID=241478 RepID=A0A183J143_9BILA|nr:unnamed protein product [Soboliphyme baturini]